MYGRSSIMNAHVKRIFAGIILFAFVLMFVNGSALWATDRRGTKSMTKYFKYDTAVDRTADKIVQGANWLFARVNHILTLTERGNQDMNAGKTLPFDDDDDYEIKSVFPGPWVYPPCDSCM